MLAPSGNTFPDLRLRALNEDRARLVEVMKLRAEIMASPEGNKSLLRQEWFLRARRIWRRRRT